MPHTTHTPGPWKWWSKSDGRPAKYDLAKLVGADGTHVLTTYGGESLNALGKTRRARANAALIEAAPVLLEALQEILYAYPNIEERYQEKAKAAISQAYGETS